ncbi:MAG: hypothetical protein BGP12_14295 [Rhodospirillales bacterium 70-18]|nr:MAG: hypothetical protein BGP12_14295 [Rhodospirillales bacterium 70-18]
MRIDWWTLGLQTVNILVLVWILARFLFRPVAAIVAARQAEAARLLASAQAARDEAGAARAAAAAEAARQAASRGETLKAAEAEAEARKQTLLAAGQAEVARLREAAEVDIAAVRRHMEDLAGDRASRLAVDIAGKLFARLPEDARIAGFIPGLAAALAGLPEAARTAIGQDGPVPLTAARALTPAEAEACRAAVSGALGRAAEIAIQVDPALIAGLEIDTPHAAARNSFRADLARIAAALARAEAAP